MAETGSPTDMGLGLGLALSALTLVGAAVMLGGGSQTTIAWGFAAATVTAVLAVVAIQAYNG